MKTITFLLGFTAMIVYSLCIQAQTNIQQLYNLNQEKAIPNFTELTVYGNYNVHIYQTTGRERCAIFMEGDPEDLKNIAYEVSDMKLTVYSKKDNPKKKKSDIYITVKSLSSLKTFGACNIETVTNIELSDVDITLSEESNLWLYVDAPRLNCSVSGSGYAQIAGDIRNLNVDVHDQSKVDLELHTQNLECTMNDFSKVYITGASKIAHSKIIDRGTIQDANSPSKESILANSEVCFYVRKTR